MSNTFLTSLFLFFVIAQTEAGIYKKNLSYFIRKYEPETVIEGSRTIHKYPNHKIEVTLSFGVTEETVRFIESVIATYYSGDPGAYGYDINKIGDAIEGTLGGLWSIAFFDDPYTWAMTVFRRSSKYMALDVNGQGIGLAKEPI